MEVFEAIRKRRSVRSYMASGIDRAQLERIIEAATWAPSAGNLQPWIFIVVDDKYLMRQLAKAALNQMWIVEASCIIAVCADVERSGRVYGERGRRLYCIQDCAAAIQNMMLAAQSIGLGTCWVGAFYDDEVKSILKLPPNIRPLALVTVGVPREEPPAPARRSLKEVVYRNVFGNPWL